MTKLWKRLGALMMTLAMVLSLGAGITAFAADPTTASITLNGITEANTAKIYQLVSYNSDSEYVVADAFATWLKTNNKGTLNSSSSSADVVDFVKSITKDDIEQLMNEYAATISTDGLPPAYKTAIADASNSVTFIGVDHGYYISIITPNAGEDMKVYSATTFFFGYEDGNEVLYIRGNLISDTDDSESIYAGSAEVKSKDVPEVVKQVFDSKTNTWQDTNTAAVDDTVNYRLQVTLPNLPAGQTFDFLVLHDTLANAAMDVPGTELTDTEKQTFLKNAFAVTTSNVKPDEVASAMKIDAVTFHDTEVLYTTNIGNYGNLEDGKQSNQIALDYKTLQTDAPATGITVYIYYSATVQADAAKTDHASNSASLNWKTNATTTGFSTDADSTNTYSFDINLNKVGKLTCTNTSAEHTHGVGCYAPLADAKFAVYTSTAETAQKLPFVAVTDGSGTYYRPATAVEIADTGVTTVTDITANFLIKGLNQGTYYLKETVTPSPFFAPTGYFKVDLVAAKEGGSTKYTGTLDGTADTGSKASITDVADTGLLLASGINITNNNEFDITVLNSTTPVLPTTGGMGTMLFTVLGVVLMALAAGLFFFRRRKNA